MIKNCFSTFLAPTADSGCASESELVCLRETPFCYVEYGKYVNLEHSRNVLTTFFKL